MSLLQKKNQSGISDIHPAICPLVTFVLFRWQLFVFAESQLHVWRDRVGSRAPIVAQVPASRLFLGVLVEHLGNLGLHLVAVVATEGVEHVAAGKLRWVA